VSGKEKQTIKLKALILFIPLAVLLGMTACSREATPTPTAEVPPTVTPLPPTPVPPTPTYTPKPPTETVTPSPTTAPTPTATPTQPQPEPQPEQAEIRLINEIAQRGGPGQALDNPISVQIVDERQQPVPGVSVRFRILRGNGELVLNNERSTMINADSDSGGNAQVVWFLGNGTDNTIIVSITGGAYAAKPLFVSAITRRANKAWLIAHRWLETHAFQFPHVLPPYTIEYDGRVLESNHFLTFSDASADGIKIEFALMAERSLLEIMEVFEIQNGSELGIVDADSKVMIYTRKHFDEQPRQYTFSYGFLLYGEDSQWMKTWYPGGYARWDNDIKHEVMHMVQYLMGVHYPMCDDWFMEGIAEEISGGAFPPIINSAQLEAWLVNPMFSVHPLDIHTTDDYPHPYLETSGKYYPMFHLIMSYLLSEKGLGKSHKDVKNMFAEIAITNDFSQAFSNHFGITTKVLKQDLYERLRQFLK
jgi:hypothetical protein